MCVALAGPVAGTHEPTERGGETFYPSNETDTVGPGFGTLLTAIASSPVRSSPSAGGPEGPPTAGESSLLAQPSGVQPDPFDRETSACGQEQALTRIYTSNYMYRPSVAPTWQPHSRTN